MSKLDHPVNKVANFMALGAQYFPQDTDYEISREDLEPFLDRVNEEYSETVFASYGPTDIPEVLDGFIDTAYAALTGAIRTVGAEKALEAWDAVVDANLAKVDGRYGPPVLDPETGKIGKPAGWTAPDIEGIVNGS